MDFMNIKTIAFSLMAGSAFAAYPGHGNVCFKGAIMMTLTLSLQTVSTRLSNWVKPPMWRWSMSVNPLI
jgi:hypothetical protein